MPSQQTPATTTQIQKVELPAWVDAASQANYAQAAATSNNLTPSAPQNVAGQTDLQAQAVDWLNQSTSQSRGYNSAAAGMYGAATQPIGVATAANAPQLSFNSVNYNPAQAAQAGGYNPVALWGGAQSVAQPQNVGDVTAKGFLDRDINAYMNPYTQNVIDATDQSSRRDESISLLKNSDTNRASGAYGGSRDAITNAVIQSEGIRNRAQTDAGLRSAGFTDAANRIQSDNALDLTAQTSNQNKGLTLNSQRLQADTANQNADIAKGQLNAQIGMNNSNQDLASRQYDASNRQAVNLANAGNQLNADQFNSSGTYNAAAQNAQNSMQIGMFNAGAQNTANLAQAQNTLAAANGMAGLGNNAASQGNAQSLLAANLGQAQQANTQSFLDAQQANATLGNTDAANALNMKLAALGMSPYGKTTTSNSISQGGQSSNPLMSILGGGLSLGSMLFGGSDRKIKKNVKNVGKIEGTDLNKYEFEYKKGFMGAPMGKQVGLMAQDVERKVPGAVSRRPDGKGGSYKAVNYGKALSHGFMGA